jgi:hypothetical protein
LKVKAPGPDNKHHKGRSLKRLLKLIKAYTTPGLTANRKGTIVTMHVDLEEVSIYRSKGIRYMRMARCEATTGCDQHKPHIG